MPPPRSSPPTVELPRGVLVALCAVAGLALMGVAFLLGRTTAPPAPEPKAQSAATLEPHAGVASPAPASPSQPVAGGTPRLGSTAPASSVAPAAAPAAVSADPNGRAAVARYFTQLEQIEASTKAGGDLQQLALQLVQQSAQGNRSGFDELLATERKARESLRALDAPPPCREHHAEALALMDEAIGLLGRLAQATATQDLGALEGFASTAHALEARTKALEALGADLKRQYGIVSTSS